MKRTGATGEGDMENHADNARLVEELRKARKRLAEMASENRDVESSAFFEFAFDHAPGGMGVVSLDGDILACNHEMASIFGYDRGELIGRKTWEFYSDLDVRKRLLDLLGKEGRIKNFEMSMSHKDGSAMWVSTSILPVIFHGKDALLVTLLDITRSRKSELALAQNEDWLQNILEGMHAGLVVIDAETHVILEVNRHAAELVGLPREGIVGRVCHSFICPNSKGGCPVTDLGRDMDNRECVLLSGDGARRILKTVTRMTRGGREYLLESFVDIQGLYEARRALEIDQIRFEKLYELSAMSERPEQDILNFALEAVVQVTDSEIGYIYFVSDDETELTLHAWSKSVMPQCSVRSIPDVYRADHAGLWGEAVRRREPVITNDYASSPLRRGLPEGHVSIMRHMNVPLFDDGKIVLLAGVGNKAVDYVEEDVRQMTLILDGTWRIIRRKRVDEALRRAHDHLEQRVEERTAELESANRDLAGLNNQLISVIRERTRAQVALRESEERFRMLFENNHTVMLLIDPDTGRIEAANPAASKFYGHTRKKLMAMNIMDLNTLSPEKVNAEMRRARKQERRYFLFQHRLASGVVRDVEVFTGPVRVGNKTVLYSIIHDVTDRIRMEAELRRFERIVSSTPDMVSLVDREYRYRLVNDAYLRAYDLWREDIIGRRVADLVDGDLFEKILKPSFDRCFAGEIVRAESWIEYPAAGRRCLALTFSPVRDDDEGIPYVAINAKDVTQRRRAEEKLQRYSDRLTLATVAGGIGIWEWEVEPDRLEWDHRMLELFGVAAEEFVPKSGTFHELVHPDDRERTMRAMRDATKNKGIFDMEFRVILPGGGIRHIQAAALTMLGEEGRAERLIGVAWDITERKEMEAVIRRMAMSDPLTGAGNRREFMRRASQEIDRSERYGLPLAFLLMDVDHFKEINDAHGHDAGDVVLKRLVEECEVVLRSTDVFCRIGGEEFAAILPQTGPDDARNTAERLRAHLEAVEVEAAGTLLRFTVSIGVTPWNPSDRSVDPVMKRADKALYAAKNAGRNKVVAY